MPDTINGIPAHVLIVHAVVVLVPIAALMLVVSAVWPWVRRKLGVLTPIVAFVALITVPLATNAGEWLRDHVADTPLIRKHTELGDSLLPWALGIFVLAAAVWWGGRKYGLEWTSAPSAPPAELEDVPAEHGGGLATRRRVTTRTKTLPTWVSAVVAAVSILVAGGAVYQLYRIGDSGAKAVWTNNFSATSHGGGDG